MATYKERMSLLWKYSKLHLFKYGEKPTHNLNSEQWAADNLIESYGLYKCYDLLDHYFSIFEEPSWKHFSYNAEKVFYAVDAYEKDKKERIERREMARKWLSE
jgi:hypothetical protein